METTALIRGKHHPVAGFVCGLRKNRDGNTKFRVVKQWFILPTNSTYAISLKNGDRVFVLFEESEKKHPKVISLTTLKGGSDGGVELRKLMSEYE